MEKRRVLDLGELAKVIRKHPKQHYNDFLANLRLYQTQLQVFLLNPKNKDVKALVKLINFLSNVADCYPKDLKEFPNQIGQLLEQNCMLLETRLRHALVRCLCLLRNRNLLPAFPVLELFFRLFPVHDKQMRDIMRGHITGDISKMARKSSDQQMKKLQNFLSKILQSEQHISARQALQILKDLFKRGVWRNERNVNAIKLGAFSKDTKVMVSTLKFFLSASGEEEPAKKPEILSVKDIERLGLRKGIAGKNKKRRRKYAKMMHERKKGLEAVFNWQTNETLHFNQAAVRMINDPQEYTAKLFAALRRSNERFEVKILYMNMVSRMLSVHKVLLIKWYPWLQKYVIPGQKHITVLLGIVAQSSHERIDPEVMQPLLKQVVCQFIDEKRPDVMIAVGLNTVREMCVRAPLLMDETLLGDLVQYAKNKNQRISAAAKSLVTLFRVVNPSLLPSRLRNKKSDERYDDMKDFEFGQEENKGERAIDGIELLEHYELMEEIKREKQALIEDRRNAKKEGFLKKKAEKQAEGDENGVADENVSMIRPKTNKESVSDAIDRVVANFDNKRKKGIMSTSRVIYERDDEVIGDAVIVNSDEDRLGNDDFFVEDKGPTLVEEDDESEEEVQEEQERAWIPLEQRRILTDEDLSKIKMLKELQRRKKMAAKGKLNSTQARMEEELAAIREERQRIQDGEDDVDIDFETVVTRQQKRENTAEIRAAKKEEREANKRTKQSGFQFSSTNQDKKKNHQYTMIKHSHKVNNKRKNARIDNSSKKRIKRQFGGHTKKRAFGAGPKNQNH